MEKPIELDPGLTIGERRFTIAVIGKPKAGAVIDACEEAEVLKLTPTGEYVLVQSPSKVTAAMARRSVLRLETADGETHPGPLNRDHLRLLEGGDYDRLLEAAEAVNAAILKAALEAAKRGRDGGPGDGDP